MRVERKEVFKTNARFARIPLQNRHVWSFISKAVYLGCIFAHKEMQFCLN